MLSYVKNERLLTRFSKNEVYIENYRQILVMDGNCVLIDCKDFLLKIKGDQLIIDRMEDKAVSVKGSIHLLEIR